MCSLSLRTQHLLATGINVAADRLSWLHPHHEWQLALHLFQQIDWRWGPHTINQMAMWRNTQLPHYHSWFFEVESAVTNGLLQNWAGENNWVAPPIALIPCVLCLIWEQQVIATIIAPDWPGCCWAWDIQDMLVERPFPLPSMPTTFITEHGILEPLCNLCWHWAAYWISGWSILPTGPALPFTCLAMPLPHPPGGDTPATSADSGTTAGERAMTSPWPSSKWWV